MKFALLLALSFPALRASASTSAVMGRIIRHGDIVVHVLVKKIYRLDLERNSVDGTGLGLVFFDGNDEEKRNPPVLPKWTMWDFKRNPTDFGFDEYPEHLQYQEMGLELLAKAIPTSDLIARHQLERYPKHLLKVGQLVRTEQGEVAALRLLFTNGDAFIVPLSTYKPNLLAYPLGAQKEIPHRQVVPAHTLQPIQGMFIGYKPQALVQGKSFKERCQALWTRVSRRGESGG